MSICYEGYLKSIKDDLVSIALELKKCNADEEYRNMCNRIFDFIHDSNNIIYFLLSGANIEDFKDFLDFQTMKEKPEGIIKHKEK